MPDTKVDEGKQNTNVDEPEVKDGKHPETVSWTQYVGLKEKFNKTEAGYKTQVQTLEEQIKTAVKPEEHAAIKKELDELKANHQKVADELKGIKEKSISEKRAFLKEKGIPDEEVKTMSEDALNAAVKVLERYKPKPDMGGGGGSSIGARSGREAIKVGFDSLHPDGR